MRILPTRPLNRLDGLTGLCALNHVPKLTQALPAEHTVQPKDGYVQASPTVNQTVFEMTIPPVILMPKDGLLLQYKISNRIDKSPAIAARNYV